MKGETRLTGIARILGFLIVLALIMGLVLPLAAFAQEADEAPGKVALSEVPSTGGRRPGPVIVNTSRIPVPPGFAPVDIPLREPLGLVGADVRALKPHRLALAGLQEQLSAKPAIHNKTGTGARSLEYTRGR